MVSASSLQKFCSTVSYMDKNQLVQQIKGFNGNFKLDFTDSYLNECSKDKLRHILMAAIMTKR